MGVDYPTGDVILFDDFLDDATRYVETVTGSATGVDLVTKHGGWIRLDVDGDDADAVTLGAELAWEADEGLPLIFEARVRSSDVDVTSMFVGFSDANNDAVVIEDEDETLNTVPVDAFGFLLEGENAGGVGDLTWQAVGVQNNTDNAQIKLTLGDDAADSVIQTLRMEATPNDSGTVFYFINGKLVSTQTSWFRSSIVYCPIISIDDRATTFQVDMDYWLVMAPRS